VLNAIPATAASISLTSATYLSGILPVAYGGTGVATSTGTGAVVLGTSPTLTTPNINSAQIPTGSGTAPLYFARAWVNFNGTGTVAIGASGNVTSITDNGTGNYTVNFTTAMPDANYAVCYEALADNADNAFTSVVSGTLTTSGVVQTRSTTAVRFNVKNSSFSSFDPNVMSCVIVR
jgi:hypothetical protein